MSFMQTKTKWLRNLFKTKRRTLQIERGIYYMLETGRKDKELEGLSLLGNQGTKYKFGYEPRYIRSNL